MIRFINKIFRRDVVLNNNSLKPVTIVDLLNLDYESFQTVFDVGAYHGSFTDAMLNKKSSLKMHVFEPADFSFKIIKKKFQKENIIVNNYAVGDSREERKLHLNNFDETNSLLESNITGDNLDELTRTRSEQKVSVTTLDYYCKYHRIEYIDFIKIDTQGNSYNVLKGATQLLTNKRIKYLYVETEFIQIYKEEKCFSEIELFLREMGYQLVNFYNLNYTQNGKIAWCDCLFTINEK